MLTQKGGSPGRVVIGGDSWSEGCGFESQHCTQDGHFFTYICCKNCLFVWKDENKQKEAGNGPFKKNIDTGFATLFNTQFTVKKCSIQINFC